ncbi:MAG: hypothetical protein KDI90_05515 [Alphaproteobacteria bacterium]|nr:hypothetical protein [Alphaproteobacteria bacterium]MCB9975576.1 hypothetical protein [Rhodospirillales bacterium]
MLPKFSILDQDQEYFYNNVYQKQVTENFSRLCIGSRSREINLLTDLLKYLDEPFFILYVLVVPRGESKAGRYQSPELTYKNLKTFLESFSEFFEHDGRMNLWVKEKNGNGLMVFDRHNYVYAYGNLNSYEEFIVSKGYIESQLTFGGEHVHYYHKEYDAQAKGVIDYFDWVYSPLREGDCE